MSIPVLRCKQSKHNKRLSMQEDENHLRDFILLAKNKQGNFTTISTVKHNLTERQENQLRKQSMILKYEFSSDQGSPTSIKQASLLQLKPKSSLPVIKSPTKRTHLRKIERFNQAQQHIISNYLNAKVKVKTQPHSKLQKSKKKNRRKKRKSPNEKNISEAKTIINEFGQQSRYNSTLANKYIQKGANHNSQGVNSVRRHNKSQFQSISLSNKEYSLKEQPLKHYVKNRLVRIKQQWKQKNPLDIETYFVYLKRRANEPQVYNRTMYNSFHKTNRQNKFKILPEKQEVLQFIKSYLPTNTQIKIIDLIKQPNFTIEYQQDQLFFGQNDQEIKNGQGILIRQKYIYEGTWKNNFRLNGYQITEAGTYNGSFINDKKQGRGQFQWSNGEIYSGEWKGGKKHGIGMWKAKKGDTYMGQWKNGVVEGQGVHKTNTGQKYEGEFKNFLKHGWGKETFPNKDYYQGYFAEGLPHGNGLYVWAKGQIYEGEFKQGFRQGLGVFKTPNGVYYKGSFVRQVAEGNCELQYGNGQIYTGEIRNGQRHGKGVLKNVKLHKVFDGFWNNGQFEQDN